VIAKNLPEITAVPRYQVERITGIYSKLLGRTVDIEMLLPPTSPEAGKKYPLLLLNDGQDNAAVRVRETVQQMVDEKKISEIIVAGVVAGDRLQEYGIAAAIDYKGRGRGAKNYTRYIVRELVPYLLYRYPVDPSAEHHAIAGYSLGGLSAMDIGWNHPRLFSKIGAFSGAFWWRKRDPKSRFYSDQRDRLMHAQVRKGKFKKGLKFWFETGTEDEQNDRNKNGVIDSIDDTLDLVVELTKKGYRPFRDIAYLEIKKGKHSPETWAQAMPVFLTWAFGTALPHEEITDN
jgi:enterochelin esterase-like enzyme